MSATFHRFILVSILIFGTLRADGAIIADHNAPAAFFGIPASDIQQAKATLHIAYGHTSHGSQLITGMDGLVGFMNGKGYPTNLYAWNNGGSGGALDLRDTPFSSTGYDLGAPDRVTWEAATRTYLNAHPEVDVIIWSWCGQVDGTESEINLYLSLMSGLEQDYPNVKFVYMTGHLTGTGATGNVNVRNQQIRNYCVANNKILYDFADIESYDPDGLVNYMALLANDNCDYDSDSDGYVDRNWATVWQSSHTINVDWFDCSPAHTQALNGNRKAYAAWWLWARLAGWGQCLNSPSGLTAVADYAPAGEIELNWTDNSAEPNNEDSFIIQRSVNGGAWNNNYATVSANVTTYTDTGLTPGSYSYRVVAHLNTPCDSSPSNVATAEIVSTDPPTAPSELAATGNPLNRTVSLGWKDNSSDENSFIVQRQVNSGAWNNSYAGTAADVNVFVDANISPGTYRYRIVAHNVYGNSTPSNESEVIIIDIPVAPSGLTATADSENGTVTLGWNDNSDSETGFIVQRRFGVGAWDNNYAVVDVNSESYIDNNKGAPPLPDGTYTYRVLAFNGNGNSSATNEAYAAIAANAPAAPSNLNATAEGFDITLTWTDNSGDEENFVIERQADSGKWYLLDGAVAPNTQTYYDGAMLPGHTYNYLVKARNGFGDSAYSNVDSATIVQQGTLSVTLKQNDVNAYTGCRDAYLDSEYPTYNFGGTLYTYVENSPKSNFAIGFDLPQAVMGKQIQQATLVFYCWSVSNWQAGQYFQLYRVTEQWEEGTADGTYQAGSSSWNIRSGVTAWSTPGGAYDPTLLASSLIQNGAHYPQFDITGLVQEWASGTTPNYGVILVNNTPVITGIKASEYSEYGRPYLTIIYGDSGPMCPNLYGAGLVDFSDLVVLADEWEAAGPNVFADLNYDGLVNLNDLKMFCNYWLDDCEQ